MQLSKEWPSEPRAIARDSGYVAHRNATPGVVYSHTVHYPETTWMQVHFDPATNIPPGSELRLTSTADGAVQTFDARTLREWSYMSAYFNGDSVRVDLIAGAHTLNNRVTFSHATRGLVAQLAESICGSADNRVQSNDTRQGRIGGGCTAWLIDSGLALTAGHCTSGSSVVEFNVPNSTSTGQRVTASPNDQYPYQFLDRVNAGIGSDWGVGRMGANSNTGLTPTQANGNMFYTLATSIPNSTTIRITGYGSSSIGNLNLVQKTHTGPLSQVQPTSLCYSVDTTGGNSGSPVVDDVTGLAVGIHTHAGCNSGGGCNNGTRIDRADLQLAIANASRIVGSSTPFGAGCAGTGQTTAGVCQQINNGPNSNVTMRDSVGYAFEMTAAQNLVITGFDLHGASRSGATENCSAGIYLPGGNGAPQTQIGSGSMQFPTNRGWRTASLTSPVAISAGQTFFVFYQNNGTGISQTHNTGATDVAYYRLTNGSWGSRVTGRFNWSIRVLCQGTSNAVPVHTTSGEPRVGFSFSADVAQALPNASSFAIIGSSNTMLGGGGMLPIPLDTIGAAGCSLLVSNDAVIATSTNANGGASVTASVPNDANLIGQFYYTQYAILDPAANSLGLVTTNGRELFIGEQ